MLAIAADAALDQVDLQLAGAQDGFGPLAQNAVAKRHPQSRQKLAHAERLFKIVIRPIVERVDLLGFAVTGRQDDQRPVIEAARLFQHFLAIQIRQTQIKNDRVRRFAGDFQQARCAGFGAHRLIARRIQGGGQEAVNLRLVVYDEDTGTRGGQDAPPFGG